MGNNRKTKNVIDTLRKETENVRRNPSSSNYARAEKEIEKAGNQNTNIGLISVLIAGVTFSIYALWMVVVMSQPSQGLTVVGPNDPPQFEETFAYFCCCPSLIANIVGLCLGGYDIFEGLGDAYSYIGTIVNGGFILIFIYFMFS